MRVRADVLAPQPTPTVGHWRGGGGVTVRVGFLGAGLIADFHAFMLARSHAAYRLAGVYDPVEERATRFANSWGAAACASEEEALASCDAVYVCAWTAEHARLVGAALERGLAVFCEKPLATDLAGARAMTEAAERSGVVNQVGLILRYSPAFALVRDLVGNPQSGRMMNVVFRDDQYLPVQGMYGSTWRADRAKAGSGTLLEHSIHDLDILEQTFGPVASVSARCANFHGLDNIEDSVAAVFSFAAGGLGVLASVWHDVLERESQRHLEVFCESLHLELHDDVVGPVAWTLTGSDERSLAGDELFAEVKRRGLSRGNADSAFIRAVTAGEPGYPCFRDALRAHVLSDAAYRSAGLGGAPVTIPPPT
jgi:predicted dehydrogenase